MMFPECVDALFCSTLLCRLRNRSQAESNCIREKNVDDDFRHSFPKSTLARSTSFHMFPLSALCSWEPLSNYKFRWCVDPDKNTGLRDSNPRKHETQSTKHFECTQFRKKTWVPKPQHQLFLNLSYFSLDAMQKAKCFPLFLDIPLSLTQYGLSYHTPFSEITIAGDW